MNVKMKKKATEKARATAMKAGVEAAGAERTIFGALSGSTERSYTGEIVAGVQVVGEEFDFRAHEPKKPSQTVGPSCPSFVVTVKSATWVCNKMTGARYAKTDRKMAVRARSGVR